MACTHDTFESRVLVSPAVQPAHYRVLLRVRCQACQEALHFALPVLPPMPGVTPIVAMSSNGQEALLAAHLALPVLAAEAEALLDEDKAFLRLAAQRHTVFHYNRIAEYYAHADAATQRLMENSALVIIDFQRAIELGYVKLSDAIAQQYAEEYGDGA